MEDIDFHVADPTFGLLQNLSRDPTLITERTTQRLSTSTNTDR